MANTYFGTDSEIRLSELPEIKARNRRLEQAVVKARQRLTTRVKKFVKAKQIILAAEIKRASVVTAKLVKAGKNKDRDLAEASALEFQSLVKSKDLLRPPSPTENLGDFLEQYRAYRDDYREFSASIDELSGRIEKLESEIDGLLGSARISKKFNSNQSLLNTFLDKQMRKVDEALGDLGSLWASKRDDYRREYHQNFGTLLGQDVPVQEIELVLNSLDRHFHLKIEQYSEEFESILCSLNQLSTGIELEAAFEATENERLRLEQQVKDLHQVAQLGITVEIIGHELETLDAEVRRNLSRLPENVKESSAYKLAFGAHHSLTERLRFLAPLKVAGYKPRQTISGRSIGTYLKDFFSRVLSSSRTKLEVTPAFDAFEIVDQPARIFPVFINLVYNSIYWLNSANERRILLDRRGALVVIADTGPGVDPDDVGRLFQLFFSRRRDGRGVGLYLCKMNLGVAGHSIRYAIDESERILPGANFIIEFKEISE